MENLMTVTAALMLIGMLIVWGCIFYYSIRSWRRRKTHPEETPTVLAPYGAWQGHNLGTVSRSYGDMTELEASLRPAETGKVGLK